MSLEIIFQASQVSHMEYGS